MKLLHSPWCMVVLKLDLDCFKGLLDWCHCQISIKHDQKCLVLSFAHCAPQWREHRQQPAETDHRQAQT